MVKKTVELDFEMLDVLFGPFNLCSTSDSEIF
jgi:hypothetical protein